MSLPVYRCAAAIKAGALVYIVPRPDLAIRACQLSRRRALKQAQRWALVILALGLLGLGLIIFPL